MVEKAFVMILAETSLENIPEEIAKHPAVVADAARRGKPAREILLDRSVHHSAMLRLKDGESRGRPDIAYHVLLDVASSPLYRSGRLDFFMHTRGELMLSFSKGLRPPRSYDRFRSLMEQLMKEGRVGGEEDLITLNRASFRDVIKKARPSTVVGLSRIGRMVALPELVSGANGNRPCFVVGGFPTGHFGEETERSFDSLASIHEEGLDASLVACRLVYEMENSIGREGQKVTG
jgi:rRNA small subunit pseudouridine methyltransferase Nep1